MCAGGYEWTDKFRHVRTTDEMDNANSLIPIVIAGGLNGFTMTLFTSSRKSNWGKYADLLEHNGIPHNLSRLSDRFRSLPVLNAKRILK